MEAMREYPDLYFDLAVVDPPYGINVTARHARGALVGGQPDPSAVKMIGESAKALSRPRFIMRSTTAPRRTRNISGSWHG